MISAALRVAGPSMRGEGPWLGPKRVPSGVQAATWPRKARNIATSRSAAVEQGDLAEDVDDGRQLGPAQATNRRGS